MTKETRKVEKTIEVNADFYISADGKEFDSEKACKEYENALRKVVNTEVVPMFKQVREFDVFNQWTGSDEYVYGIVRVTEENFDKLRLFADLNDCYENVKYNGVEHKFTKEYVGKVALFSLGYVDEVDSLSFYGSTNEWYRYMADAMCEALKLD